MVCEVRRVLMTADTVGGVFSYATTLARELGRHGVTVHLATMGELARPEQREVMRAVPSLVLHESTFALEWMDDPWEDVERAAAWLRDVERAARPDVVHLNGYAHASAGFDAPVLVAAHSCVLSWWQAVFAEPAPGRYDRYRDAVAKGLAAADAVVAPTAAMLACLEAHYGPLRDARVIRNGAPPPSTERVPKEPIILAAGRVWDRAKNIDAVARIAARLPWRVVVAGWGAEALRDTPGVEAVGFASPGELSRLMARASLFALPARYEPFGLSALEAALHGCALVLGDIPSLREVWSDAAVFVRPDDDDALVAALERLTRAPAHLAAMAERAAERASRYRPAVTAAETLAVYDALVRRRSFSSCA